MSEAPQFETFDTSQNSQGPVVQNAGSAAPVPQSTENIAPGTNTPYLVPAPHPRPLTMVQLGVLVDQQAVNDAAHTDKSVLLSTADRTFSVLIPSGTYTDMTDLHDTTVDTSTNVGVTSPDGLLESDLELNVPDPRSSSVQVAREDSDHVQHRSTIDSAS